MPSGSISDEKGIDKIGEEGERGGECLHPDLTFFWSPNTSYFEKKHVELSWLFFEPANFFMNAAPTGSKHTY